MTCGVGTAGSNPLAPTKLTDLAGLDLEHGRKRRTEAKLNRIGQAGGTRSPSLTTCS